MTIIEEINPQIDECTVFLSPARDSTLQEEAYSRLESLINRVGGMKETAVSEGKEEQANLLLGFECVINCLMSEIQMWLLLKRERPDDAWDCLVSSQMGAVSAVRAHDGFSHLADHAKRLEAIEKLVFPPQVFMSSGFTAKRQICSICGEEYGECEHVVGLPYMGKFCCIFPEGLTFDHAAIGHLEEPSPFGEIGRESRDRPLFGAA